MYKDKFEGNDMYFQRISEMSKPKVNEKARLFEEPLVNAENKPANQFIYD